MSELIKSSFEKKVMKGLELSGAGFNFSNSKKFQGGIGIGVSGGADSMALLVSLVNIFSQNKLNLPLYVITVNHFIRPKEETAGDAQFVVDFCNDLKSQGFNISVKLVELGEGAVKKTALIRQSGIEDAARFLRYKAFDSFINEYNLDFLCVAHNKNDQLETLLMRFLQGSSVDSAMGIRSLRGKFLRPLINISRKEIEEYLTAQNISWCNDKTNEDINYFRNNIRHNLIPFLNDKFSGWEKSVLSGGEKALEDSHVINTEVEKFEINLVNENGRKENCTIGQYLNNENIKNITFGNKKINEVYFDYDNFEIAGKGIGKRILIRASNIIGEEKRIPNVFLDDVIKGLENSKQGFMKGSKIFHNTEISLKNNWIFVKKYIKKHTDLVFFDIIEESGDYDFPFGKLFVTLTDSGVYFSVNGCETFVKCHFPLCIRNYYQGDEILNRNGQFVKVADIFSSWHVSSYFRDVIPVIYQAENGPGELKCILGSFLGYKDWVVK